MVHQIVKQPNGKFAVWSTVVDDFVAANATVEEMIEYQVEASRQEITERIQSIVKGIEEGNPQYYQFTKSLEDCLEIVKRQHGQATYKRRKKSVYQA